MDPKNYKVRVYTGPVEVSHMAQKIRTIGFPILSEGTESVWCRVIAEDKIGAVSALCEALRKAYGSRYVPSAFECRIA